MMSSFFTIYHKSSKCLECEKLVRYQHSLLKGLNNAKDLPLIACFKYWSMFYPALSSKCELCFLKIRKNEQKKEDVENCHYQISSAIKKGCMTKSNTEISIYNIL